MGLENVPVRAPAFGALLVATAIACASGTRPAEDAQAAKAVCGGLSDADVRDALDVMRTNIDAVEPDKANVFTKPVAQKLVGAIIHVRATPGMTAPYLARLLRCHALKDLADQRSATGRCPLALRDVQVDVAEQATGFSVSLESQDPDVAAEILRRSEALRSLP